MRSAILAWTTGVLLLAPGPLSHLASVAAAAALWVWVEEGKVRITYLIHGLLRGVALSALSVALVYEADSIAVAAVTLVLMLVVVIETASMFVSSWRMDHEE